MSNYVCKGAEQVHVSEPAELVYMRACIVDARVLVSIHNQ